MTRLHLAMASALMQVEGYRSERLGQALEDARRAAADTALVELQCEVALSPAAFLFAAGRNRDYLTLANQQLGNHAVLLPPAYVNGLWSSKGVAHFNRGEWRFAIEALRKARDLIDRTEASCRILLGGGDQLIVTHAYFFRSLVAMGFIDETVETAERFVQTIDWMEKPFDIAWALFVKCNLSALLGRNDVLLQDAAKIIEISERHGYTTRLSYGLSLRGLVRSRLGELNAGIDDVREGMVLWRGQDVVFNTPERICWLCDLLVQAGRLDEASHLLDEADALVIDTDEAGALAECNRIRGQIAACGNDLTGAVRLYKKSNFNFPAAGSATIRAPRHNTTSIRSQTSRACPGGSGTPARHHRCIPYQTRNRRSCRCSKGAGDVAPIDSRLSAGARNDGQPSDNQWSSALAHLRHAERL